ncbi:hypothetical protein RSOL_230490 [Rhizoctonia solani AG-3 Rhs1AP]|uniref:Uncharacterized protein n=2 Tax=Rhizoctonia solani AG-3 TaxID=1086053 RepID=A0A074RTT8_9AGAM|nr:hypothetical protein RSOL_230490 [Rhizoctonia solani AG-3 Rhs1AP]KEP50264.1 hypothetical protein V565_083120 [Rhizoctonia solani 123E]
MEINPARSMRGPTPVLPPVTRFPSVHFPRSPRLTRMERPRALLDSMTVCKCSPSQFRRSQPTPMENAERLVPVGLMLPRGEDHQVPRPSPHRSTACHRPKQMPAQPPVEPVRGGIRCPARPKKLLTPVPPNFGCLTNSQNGNGARR